jgi:hypothetical protein
VADRKTTPLQERLITVLAAALSDATLTGGAALAAFHTKQRTTRDLDLFFHGRTKLDPAMLHIARDSIRDHVDHLVPLQSGPSFARFEAVSGSEVVIIDLIASPVDLAEPPVTMYLHGVPVRVDTAHEILVNKVVALLSRSELRDLVDVRALVELGGDLDKALSQASLKDGGFSPLTLAWVLRSLPIERLAKLEHFDDTAVDGLLAFRDALIQRLLEALA